MVCSIPHICSQYSMQHVEASVSILLGLGGLHNSLLLVVLRNVYAVYSLGQVRDLLSSHWVRGESSVTFKAVDCGCRMQRFAPPPLWTLFYSACFKVPSQATQRKGGNSQDVRRQTGERLWQEGSSLCALQFQLFRGCSAQASRELRSGENGIFPVAVQTCFNHRNEHKMRLVPSAIVWIPFPSSRQPG